MRGELKRRGIPPPFHAQSREVTLGKESRYPSPSTLVQWSRTSSQGDVGHKTMSSTALLEETDLFGTEHGEFHPMDNL